MAQTVPYDEAVPQPRFRLRTFGGLSIEARAAAVPAAVNQRKRLAFLAVLAAAGPRGIARDRVLLLLWPESTTERARGALYQLLYVVRQAFGDSSINGTDELSLDANIVRSDVVDFMAALSRDDLTAAVDVYSGPFLDAVHLSGAPELERWVEQKRQELARAYQGALAQLGARAMERQDHASAITYAERLVAADPLSERATVLLMEALAANGDTAAALDRARAHAAIVRKELGADLGASVSHLVARLRSNSQVAPLRVSRVEAPPANQNHSSTQSRRPSRAIAWTLAGVVVMAIALVAAMRREHDQPIEFAVLADFQTAPVDSQIADALTDVMRRVLTESRVLRAVPDDRLHAVRERLHIPAAARLDRSLAQQVALSDGIRGYIVGSLKSFGGAYAISLELHSASSGQVLTSVHGSGIATTRIFPALDTLTRHLREQAGDDLNAIRAQPSLVSLTSTSLQAMTDYATAIRLPRDSGARAVALLRDAVRLDSTFASALYKLSYYIENTGPMSDSAHRALLARAWNHREGLTEYEQLRVEIAYKFSENGTEADGDEHLAHLRRVVERYPNAPDALILGNMYTARRDLAGAERSYRLIIALDSMRRDGYSNLVITLLRAKRLPEARREVDAFARRFGARDAALSDLFVSYAEGRQDRVREILEGLMAGAGQGRLLGYILSADLELLAGRVASYERIMHAKDALSDRPPVRPPGLRSDRLAENYWVLNDPGQALRMLGESVAGDPSLRSNLTVIEFYAQFGNPDSARALLKQLGKTDRTVYWKGTDTLPASAWIDLADGRYREAAAKFRASLRYSGGDAPSQFRLDAETGLAFEKAGLADSAIKVYEHYLDAPPQLESDAFKLAWVLEKTAALYEKRGDRAKASARYARFAELWKDADPQLQPTVRHARERAAALR